MPGFIYFFSTFGDRAVFKAGRTDQQSLAARFKSYLGPSKPRMIIASREVDDTVAAEDMMLRLLRSSRVLQVRPDLGTEWFSADTDDAEEVHATVRFIFEVVQKAVRDVPAEEVHPKKLARRAERDLAEDEYSHQIADADTLPAMGCYFEAFDKYVDNAPCGVLTLGIERIVTNFESDRSCPVFAEYLLWPKDARVRVAKNRFPHLDGPTLVRTD